MSSNNNNSNKNLYNKNSMFYLSSSSNNLTNTGQLDKCTSDTDLSENRNKKTPSSEARNIPPCSSIQSLVKSGFKTILGKQHQHNQKNNNNHSLHTNMPVPVTNQQVHPCTSLENTLTDQTNVVRLRTNMAINFVNDDQTKLEINKKLAYLTVQERIQLQKHGLDLLKQEIELKQAQKLSLKEHIKKLNDNLVKQKEQLRSTNEIEQLKKEITELSYQKAQLEYLHGMNNKWSCSRCTFLNNNDSVICEGCQTERDLNDTIICNKCSSRNSFCSSKCKKCNSSLDFLTTQNNLQITDENNNNPRTRSNSNSSLCENSIPSPVACRLSSTRLLNSQTSSSSNCSSVFTPNSPPIGFVPYNQPTLPFTSGIQLRPGQYMPTYPNIAPIQFPPQPPPLNQLSHPLSLPPPPPPPYTLNVQDSNKTKKNFFKN